MLSLLFTAAFAQDFVDAQLPELNAQRFRPSLDAKRTIWTDDAQRGEHLRFFLRPIFSYTHRPLVYEYESGRSVGLVNNILQADLMAGFHVDRFRVGVDVPIYLFAESENNPSLAGLGDLALDGKLSILDGESPLGLALQGRVGFPTGTRKIPLGSHRTTWEASVIVDKGIADRVYLMANLGYRGGPSSELENIKLNDFFAFRAAAALAFTPQAGAALEFNGDIPFTGTNTIDGLPMEALLSGYGRVAPSLKIRGGAGVGLTPGVGSPDFRVMLGFSWEAEKDLDKDKDGILDADDLCPEVPEDLDGEADEDGCPENVGSVKIMVVDAAGKPIAGAKSVIPKTDYAGSENLSAELPGGDYSVQAEAEGYLPNEAKFTVTDPDVDKEVKVTLEPVPMGTLQVTVKDAEGNPLVESVVITVDGEIHKGAPFEGVLLTGAHEVTASANGYRKAPAKSADVEKDETTLVEFVLEPAQAKVEGEKIDLRDSVYFDVNKDIIQERSYGLLEDVANILIDHPELTKIRIEGHTDSRGKADYNKELSQRRATAVQTYLVDKGVEIERLEAVGYGEERPLDKRENSAAWDKNRRVDFFVADRSD